MNALHSVISKIWEGAPLTGDDRIALLLLLAMLASLSHLFTMLVTRWGDHHIAVKSLMASLLVHAVCILGLEVFDPLEMAAPVRLNEAETQNLTETKILVQSDDAMQLSESGNTAVPDQPVPPDVTLQRLPHEARIMDVPETPERQQEVLDSLQADVEDVSKFEQSDQPESAIAVDAGKTGPRETAASDTAAEVETMLEQSQADVFVPSTERLQTQRGEITPAERSPEREMSAGQTPQIDTQIATEDSSLQTVTGDSPDAARLPAPDMADRIERRHAPVTGVDPDDIVGPNDIPRQKESMAARSFESRLPRPSRTLRSPAAGERPVRQNSLIPQTPIPLTSEYDEVRSGMVALNITDALRSAAELVESDSHSIRRRTTQPATYELRNLDKRKDVARKFGGTAESEAAVELSLKWLKAMQSPDGHWDAENFGAGQVRVDEQGVNRNYAGRDADTGITALVTLSFLGAGYTHEEGRYAMTVDRALDWIIRQQGEDGNLSGSAGHYARMYCHAMATYALAEALGMQKDVIPEPILDPAVITGGAFAAQGVSGTLLAQCGMCPHILATTTNSAAAIQADITAFGLRKVHEINLRAALHRAVTFTVSQQDPGSGGWRYKPGQEGDVSMFGWQMMSLKSAAIAGISIHPTVRENMIEFLNSVRQGDNGGLFGYRRSIVQGGKETEPVSPVMTAEALFCQQMLGYPRDSAASREAVQYLLRHRPRLSQLNMYYWYYGTLAMYQYGGQPWDEWNGIVRDTLIDQQRHDGEFAGSWDPNGPWGRYGGRLYATAISTLTLEVYYRLLPLYRMNETNEQQQAQ